MMETYAISIFTATNGPINVNSLPLIMQNIYRITDLILKITYQWQPFSVHNMETIISSKLQHK
uniref:Putative ovule protein n=1 Tax=Solanum chacoense TaxID=4108 RepID=A0A0V0GM88_SOLCH